MEGEESPEKKASSASPSPAENGSCSAVTSSDADATVLCRKETTSIKEEDKLSLITWNVDGLDGDEQPERARSLCSYLIS